MPGVHDMTSSGEKLTVTYFLDLWIIIVSEMGFTGNYKIKLFLLYFD